MVSTSPPQVATYSKAIKVTVDGPREPRSKTRQQQQFHFAFGQRPFPFATSDPLSSFRMPPIGNCNNMTQFGLTSTNSHWSYGAAGAYSPYFTPSSLGSCGATTTAQFNTPALGFSGSGGGSTGGAEPSTTQDAFGSASNVSLLPDAGGTDLDQHLGLVASQNHTTGNHTTSSSASLLVPRYPANPTTTDFTLSGPRSLSDNSSTAESPVQDDILSTQSSASALNNHHHHHHHHHVNNANFQLHQNMASSTTAAAAATTPTTYPTTNCNNSIYPVLPASLLYSQLYTAANQTHNFHTLHHTTNQNHHHNHHHHNDIQSVMDQLSATTAAATATPTQPPQQQQQQQNTTTQRQMNNGATELILSNNGGCGAATNRQQDDAHSRVLTNNGAQRGPAQNSDAVVWRPY